jgi:hypothetical protein
MVTIDLPALPAYHYFASPAQKSFMAVISNSSEMTNNYSKNKENEKPLFFEELSPNQKHIYQQMVAIGQEKIFDGWQNDRASFLALLKTLEEVDRFYQEMGGIEGYHFTTLRLLKEAKQKGTLSIKTEIPTSIDITEETPEVREMIFASLKHLNEFAEFYPIGGAGDRLHLVDPITHEDLPAAKYTFMGKTLLEILFDDLIAREYLYFKIFHKSVTVPQVLMTSEEKKNHPYILQILEENNYFGRSKDAIFFYRQPLAPTLTEEGQWCLKEPLQLLLKPGGHGVIWKGTREGKILSKLLSMGKKKALVRQINNPISGIDYGLLACCGYGVSNDKLFGCISCPREVLSAEGILTMAERNSGFVLKNIEYCDLSKHGISDAPKEPHSIYSPYPSNTNILFIDLKAIQKASKTVPFPGLLVNKKEVFFERKDGTKGSIAAARLECLMQNISEVFVGSDKQKVPSFIVSNVREKTISAIKKLHQSGKSPLDTVEKCFYDTLLAHKTLLEKNCNMKLPSMPSLEECLEKGFPFVFNYHPALGPLYSIIQQKIQKGSIGDKSEMQLQIAEAFIDTIDIDGSFIVKAKDICGKCNHSKVREYSSSVGRIYCKNVKILNKGINWEQTTAPWTGAIVRKEGCYVNIEGNGEFYAEDVTIKGDQYFTVKDQEILRLEKTPEGFKEIRMQKKGSLPSWEWAYRVTKDDRISLTRVIR